MGSDPEALTARALNSGKTGLHFAVEGGMEDVVKVLVNMMREEDVKIQDSDGKTALAYAAEKGSTEIARCIVEKHPQLASIGDILPVVLASRNSRWTMVKYLVGVTPIEDLRPEKGLNDAALLCQCIYAREFVMARNLLKNIPELIIAMDEFGQTPLKALAVANASPLSQLRFWQRWIYRRISISVADKQKIEQETHEKSTVESSTVANVSRLLKRIWVRYLRIDFGYSVLYERKLYDSMFRELITTAFHSIYDLDDEQRQDAKFNEAIFLAIHHGNAYFISQLCFLQPQLIWSRDEVNMSTFHHAISYRQGEILGILLFNSLSHKGSVKKKLHVDKFNNNLLHMVARLPPSQQLNSIPGAALQMQRELQWFKEVERQVPREAWDSKNYINHMTPRELFTHNHKELMKEGEKWMKETANSCTVLGALVITIVFAAAITVPRGNDENTGLPVSLKTALFSVFIISDALSLFSSTTSLLMFWGIITSRYGEDDFLKSLPTKMAVGLFTLLFSLTCMMIAFCSALLIMLDGRWMAIPLAALVSVPFFLSLWMLIPLCLEMFSSTFGRVVVCQYEFSDEYNVI